MAFDYDLFVIGGGSGGVRAGRMSANHGARVAIAEEYRMGGTCVIRGCVPKKLMVYASSYADHFEDAAGFGWSVGETSFDWAKLVAAKEAEITRLEGLYGANLERSGVTIIKQRARITGANSVRLADGTEVTAKYILVATGGTPFVPGFPGSDRAITSNEVFDLPKQPRAAVIVGGGYIASEFAGILNGLGTKVTQVYRGPQILRGFDNEVREHVAGEMAEKGIDIRTDSDVARIDPGADLAHMVTLKDGSKIEADIVMYATGRVPHTSGLGLEEAGVELGVRGEIPVDRHGMTNVPSIYAVGDVTDRVALTPVAIREGAAFAETVFNNNPLSADHELVATAVFTQPEIGTVGLSEEDAAQKHDIEVYAASFRPMVATLSGRKEKMLTKLVVDKVTRKVLGCHIVGHAAGEMIQLAGVALKMGATKEDFDRTVAVHPTAAEELVTMKEPVR